VCFDPITATIGAIGSLAAGSSGTLSTIGTIAGLVGTGVTALGTISAGNAANAAAKSEAAQLEQQATQARASYQRKAMQHQRQTELTMSQLQARAAASGAGADDPTVIKLGEEISGRGEEQALMDLYNGENTARGLEDRAVARRASGRAARTGSIYSAAGTIASGVGTGFQRFAGVSTRLPDANSTRYG